MHDMQSTRTLGRHVLVGRFTSNPRIFISGEISIANPNKLGASSFLDYFKILSKYHEQMHSHVNNKEKGVHSVPMVMSHTSSLVDWSVRDEGWHQEGKQPHNSPDTCYAGLLLYLLGQVT